MKQFEKFLELKKKFEDSVKENGESSVKEFFKEWFDQHPDVYGVKWSQYTPYYNDGDECVFRVYDAYTFKDQHDFENTDRWDGEEDSELTDKLQTLEDILKFVFGDHVEISVTRESLVCDEYEHD